MDLINGSPHGCISPTQGLRQGDPLFPYLFLLCAKGLSALLLSAEQNRQISGLPIVRGGFKLSHLFFYDDSLLFCRATFLGWCSIHSFLDAYERALGQKINWSNTSLFFSRNTSPEFKDHILSIGGLPLPLVLQSIWAYQP
jgi:hypothetical protein